MFDQAGSGIQEGSGVEEGVSSALAALRVGLNAPLALEAGLLDDYRRLVVEQRRLAARELDLLAEIDATHAAVQVAGHTTSGFVAEVSGCTASVARRRVRHSERLTQPRWAPLADALRSGRIGVAHVEVLLHAANPRIEDAVTTLLPELLQLAEVATFTRFAREVRGIAHRLDQDGGYDPNADPDSNRLRMSTGPDGSLHLEVDLVGELALMVRAVIDAATEAVRNRYRADHKATVSPDGTGGLPVPSLSRCAAEGLADVLQRGAGVADDDEVLLHPDAVVVLRPTETGDLLDAEITDILGNPLPRALTSYILAAGNMWPIEFSEDGDPLRAGTKVRFATPQQRRALAVRDGGCVFPGCTRKAEQTDAHHVEWWHEHDGRCPPDCELEGPTNIENLASLCRHHHRVTHRPRWTMQLRTDVAGTHFTWTTPTGDTIYSQRHGITTRPPQSECAGS